MSKQDCPIEASDRYVKARRAVDRLKDGSLGFRLFRWRVLDACERARQYAEVVKSDPQADPYERARREDQAALKDERLQQHALRLISRYAKVHPRNAGFALANALVSVWQATGCLPLSTKRSKHGVLIPFKAARGLDTGVPGSLSNSFVLLIDAYADALKEPIAKHGPFTWRWYVANMIYPHDKPVDRFSARMDISTGLLFELVLYARLFTSGAGLKVVDSGMRMPNVGRPLYRCAAEFASAALSREISSDDAKKRIERLLRKHPDMGLGRWPTRKSRNSLTA